jgi:tellurite resistance protein
MLNVRFNMDPMLEAVHTPMPRRSPSPDSSDEESDVTLYNPTPSPRMRSTRARLAKKDSQETLFSRSPTPLIERSASPAPSSFSTSSEVKVKVEKRNRGLKKPKKRSGTGARKGEPRRCQNMIAQKKYRDKKVQASALVSHYHDHWIRAHLQMSDTMVDIKAALKYASTKKRLEMIQSLVDQYNVNMRSELISVAALISRS